MPDRPPRLLRAAWVAPMDAPLLRDGAVLIAGNRVAAMGPASQIAQAHGNAIVDDFGDAVILPGLVNAHAHLELSHLTPPADASVATFSDWLLNVFRSASPTSDEAEAAVQVGIDESVHFGVTTLGDIASAVLPERRALSRTGLGGVSYGEVVGMAGRKRLLEPRLAAAATDLSFTNERLGRGVSPHAPYSVDADGYRRCLDAARRFRLPLTTHLAESPGESAFLSEHAGPFRQLWERIGAWDGGAVPRFAGGPVRYAESLGLLDYSLTLLAHVNYCDDDELEILARGRAGVVYCPRTHAYFGHPPHRWRDMLAAGINVCVGTDSRASSPDLNLVDDLRLLHALAPEVGPRTLWEMATVRAARAIGLGQSAGVLAPGRPANCVVFPSTPNDPLREVLENGVPPVSVWAEGEELFRRA